MLEITIPEQECFNNETLEFVTFKQTRLCLEHSLISIKKWEQKHHKPFLNGIEKLEPEELIDYIRCMTINQVPAIAYDFLTTDNYNSIKDYMNDPMTATKITEQEGKGHNKGDMITNELIYYWMIANEIPPEYEKWHINSLLTLIRVCSIKNQPQKKMSGKDQASRYRSTMAHRRAKKPH